MKTTDIDFSKVKQLAEDTLDEYKAMLLSGGHSATGSLVKDSKVIVLYDNGVISIEFDLPEYWKYVEDGTRPHMPPVDKILEWVKVKHLMPRPMRNGQLPTQEGIAWMVANKIKKFGTTGTGYLKEAFYRTNLQQEAARLAAEAIADSGLSAAVNVLYE